MRQKRWYSRSPVALLFFLGLRGDVALAAFWTLCACHVACLECTARRGQDHTLNSETSCRLVEKAEIHRTLQEFRGWLAAMVIFLRLLFELATASR